MNNEQKIETLLALALAIITVTFPKGAEEHPIREKLSEEDVKKTLDYMAKAFIQGTNEMFVTEKISIKAAKAMAVAIMQVTEPKDEPAKENERAKSIFA